MAKPNFIDPTVDQPYTPTQESLGQVSIDLTDPKDLMAVPGLALKGGKTTGVAPGDHTVIQEIDEEGRPTDRVALVRIPGTGIKELEP